MKDSTEHKASQTFCPIIIATCKRKECALWDENWNECGILSVSEGLERLVDIIIDRSKK